MSTTRINRFVAKAGQAEALKAFLSQLIPYITASTGCEGCELFQQENQKTEFYIVEKWHSKADHQASIAGFPKEKMQAAMDLLAEAPQGNYYQLC
ncbi:hypothetical protein R50072_04020 [Simiduia litorea]|uniref:putative quinol monooxygenase n=1 Tax=Simiduia litorea TaxID=1435348 RepID=UPI0036F41780